MKNFVSQFCDNENTIDLISLLEFKITNPICTCRDATGNPRNPFPEVPGRFSPPHSPVIKIQHPVPAPVPATIPRVPPKSNCFDNFLHVLNFFYKKMCDPHYIWLFLILVSSTPCNFVISNHESHIILLIFFKKMKIIFSIKRNFKLTSNLKPNTPRISPEHGKQVLVSPIPRGMKIAGELASLFVIHQG